MMGMTSLGAEDRMEVENEMLRDDFVEFVNCVCELKRCSLRSRWSSQWCVFWMSLWLILEVACVLRSRCDFTRVFSPSVTVKSKRMETHSNQQLKTTTNADGTSTSLISGPITTKEKAQNKNDVKERIDQTGLNFYIRTLKQIHEDDIEEMDLKWQLALLSMRTRRGPRKQDREQGIKTSLEGHINCGRQLLRKPYEMAIVSMGFD
ncbi:hypothetical protein Tco_0133877 [Tanacetum coccineum]